MKVILHIHNSQLLRYTLFSCILILSALSSASAKTIKYNSHLIYEGEVVDKEPCGEGVLCLTLNDKKDVSAIKRRDELWATNDPLSRRAAQKMNVGNLLQDIIIGNFKGNNVTNSNISFASGWKYKGCLSVNIQDSFIEYTLESGGFVKVNNNGNFIQLLKPLTIKRTFNGMGVDDTYTQFSSKDIWSGIESYYNFAVNSQITSTIKTTSNGGFESDSWEIQFYGDHKNSEGVILTIYKGRGHDFGGRETELTLSKITWPNGDYCSLGLVQDIPYPPYRLTLADGTRIEKIVDNRFKKKMYLNNGDRFEGAVCFNKQIKKSGTDNYLIDDPSINPTSPQFFKKLTFNQDIVMEEGTYYKVDGSKMNYKDGYSNLELEAARNKAAIAKQEEQRKQAQARAEKEKNTKATQSFLNSAWGKKFTFNGYGDQYGNYNHGSSVLTFSSNHSDIWLDVAGTTTHFKIDHINGEDIWVKDIYAYVSAVTITPIKRNGKQAFKVKFYSLDTTYILY